MQNEIITPEPTHKTQQIAYWPDGYWIRDVQEAATLDQYEAFGSIPHRVTEVAAHASAEQIEAHVLTLCTGLNPQPCVPCAQGSDSEMLV
jgi:hypothetical protein